MQNRSIIIMGGLAAVLWALSRTDAGQEVIDQGRQLVGLWRPPVQYQDAIAAAEQSNGLPKDMLARLLWQESRYRDDIISGAKRSPAGAIGIAQFMPGTARDMGIEPSDPWQSISAAARYLAQQYKRFGDWASALASYNWGPGNVSRYGVGRAPAETQNYVAQILGDLGMT